MSVRPQQGNKQQKKVDTPSSSSSSSSSREESSFGSFGYSRDYRPQTSPSASPSSGQSQASRKTYEVGFILSLRSGSVRVPPEMTQIPDVFSSEPILSRSSLSAPKHQRHNDYYKKGSPSRSGKGSSSKQYPSSQTPHTNESSKFIIETSDSWSQRTQRTKQLHEQLMSQTRGLLNKLSNKNFSSVTSQLVAIANNNTEAFKGVMGLAHEKAISEPKYSKIYARLFKNLKDNAAIPHAGEDFNVAKIVIDLCKKVYDEVILEEPSRELLESKGVIEREDLMMAFRRQRTKKIGNIVFIGELFLIEILGSAVVHKCIIDLLSNVTIPHELILEALCALIRTCGHKIDTPKAKSYIDQYFDRIGAAMKSPFVSLRIRFMLQDIVELRTNNWKHRKTTAETATAESEVDRSTRSTISYTLNSYGSSLSRAGSSPSSSASSASPGQPAMPLYTILKKPAPESASSSSAAAAPVDLEVAGRVEISMESFLEQINPLLQDFYRSKDKERTLSLFQALFPTLSPDLQSTLIYNLIVESLENQDAWTAAKSLVFTALTANFFSSSSFSSALENLFGDLQEHVIDMPYCLGYICDFLKELVQDNLFPAKTIAELLASSSIPSTLLSKIKENLPFA
eukprot:TRINITY_DN602_c0_g1_i1.p1 TRINITY_DN602_c0_g1~~TRINITY_DN602_c0_g1_i1.p1  ORF type:complete len:642 (-),score=307.00 TRINITY_DN602_c0_g1_i1:46-1923(-)